MVLSPRDVDCKSNSIDVQRPDRAFVQIDFSSHTFCCSGSCGDTRVFHVFHGAGTGASAREHVAVASYDRRFLILASCEEEQGWMS